MWLHSFFTSALEGNEWLASCTDRFTPCEIIRVSIEGGRAGVGDKKTSLPTGIRALDRAVRNLITTLTELPWLLKLKRHFKIDSSSV